MASLTKAERSLLHRVKEQGRIQKQHAAENLPAPPKRISEEVVAAALQRDKARYEPVPSVELVEGKGGTLAFPDTPKAAPVPAAEPVKVEAKRKKAPVHRAQFASHVPPGVGEPRPAKKEEDDANAR